MVIITYSYYIFYTFGRMLNEADIQSPQDYFKLILNIENIQPEQRLFFEWQLSSSRQVNVLSKKDMTIDPAIDAAIRQFLEVYIPQNKNCFQNAYMLACIFPDEFLYVEGVFSPPQLPIGLDHAWNKHIPTGKYIDTTALLNPVHFEPFEYLSIIEMEFPQLMELSIFTGIYGPHIGMYYQTFVLDQKNK